MIKAAKAARRVFVTGVGMTKVSKNTCFLRVIFCFVQESCSFLPLFRNKRFALNEMFQRNASKFAIFYVKEKPCSFFRFSFRASLLFPL